MGKLFDHVYTSLCLELECIDCGASVEFKSDVDNACAFNVDPSREGMISIDEWIELAADRVEKTLGWIVVENGLVCNECKSKV